MASATRHIKAALFKRVLQGNPRLLKLIRAIQFKVWHAGVALRRITGKQSHSTNEVIWVRPDSITQYIGDLPYSRYSMRGRVVSGNWDAGARPFRGWDLFKAMQAHFTDSVPWEETDFFKRVSNEINGGAVKWGCSSVEAFRERLGKLEHLFNDIQQNGYKQQAELKGRGTDRFAWERGTPFEALDEVTICIDRTGRVLLRDGKHRLSIAKILDLQEIPVVVGLRHEQWEETRRLAADVRARVFGSTPPSIPHPDLSLSGTPPEDLLISAIREALPAGYRSILDLSNDFGYHGHILATGKAKCSVVVAESSVRTVLERLQASEQLHFQLMSPEAAGGDISRNYDVVLALGPTHLLDVAEFASGGNKLPRWQDTRVLIYEVKSCNRDAEILGDHIGPELGTLHEQTGFSTMNRLSFPDTTRFIYIFAR